MNDDNPYRAPRKPAMPSSPKSPYHFRPDQVISRQASDLRRAGWLALVSATITLPYYGLSMSMQPGDPLQEVALMIGLMMTAISIIILQKFRRLLHERSQFFAADREIRWLIQIAIVSTTISVFETLYTLDSDGLALLEMLLTVVYGGVLISFARRLLTCRDDLYGRLKPLSYLLLGSGVLIVTLVLILLSILTSVISDLLFATIFFSAATELAKVQQASEAAADVASSDNGRQ